MTNLKQQLVLACCLDTDQLWSGPKLPAAHITVKEMAFGVVPAGKSVLDGSARLREDLEDQAPLLPVRPQGDGGVQPGRRRPL